MASLNTRIAQLESQKQQIIGQLDRYQRDRNITLASYKESYVNLSQRWKDSPSGRKVEAYFDDSLQKIDLSMAETQVSLGAVTAQIRYWCTVRGY